jgi:hypothetical protein
VFLISSQAVSGERTSTLGPVSVINNLIAILHTNGESALTAKRHVQEQSERHILYTLVFPSLRPSFVKHRQDCARCRAQSLHAIISPQCKHHPQTILSLMLYHPFRHQPIQNNISLNDGLCSAEFRKQKVVPSATGWSAAVSETRPR